MLLATGGCSAPDFDEALAAIVTDAGRDLAERLVTLLQDRRFEEARSLMWTSEVGGVPDSAWLGLSESLRGIDPESMRLVDAGVLVEGDGPIRTVIQTYEAPATDGWRQVRVISLEGRASGVYVQHSGESLVEQSRLRNAPISTEQATALLWGLSAWVVALGAAVRVIRARMPWRWLWAPLSFVMVGQVQVDWTTGESGVLFFSAFAPPTHWFKASLITPWVLSVGVPVFAMLAWKKAVDWERSPSRPRQDAAAPGRWVVYRSTPEGGRVRLGGYAERSSAEAHAQRLRSAGLDVRYWVEEADA